MRFIGSTPDSDGRMVSETSDFIKGIRLECFRLGYIIICHIQPEVIPYHYSVFITIVIKFIIGHTTCPQTNHIVIHLLMQTDLRFIFFTLATKQILTHPPVSTFQVNLLPIDKECQYRISHYVIYHLILILLDTECHFLYIRHLSVNRTSQLAGIEIRFTITIRPPKFRVINDQLFYFFFIYK